jgi:hypothetical protein
MRYISLILLAALVTASCKKDKQIEFTLNGLITDATFGGGLDGATVTLTEISVGGASPSQQVASATLDASGGYSFTFQRNKVEKYILQVDKPNYFSITAEIPFSSFSTEKPLVKTYSTNAKAWVKIHLVNDAPALPTDELIFRKQAGKTDCNECCTNAEQSFEGLIDTVLYCVNNGNTTYSFYYNVTGTADQGIHQIETTAFDTVEMVLNY